MARSLLSRIKDKKLTSIQEMESLLVFQRVTEAQCQQGKVREMGASELRICLSTLGLPTTKAEARALIYEVDYRNREKIDLHEFQRIYLAKALEVNYEELLFKLAIRSYPSIGGDKINLGGSILEKARELGIDEKHLRRLLEDIDEDTSTIVNQDGKKNSSFWVNQQDLATFIGLQLGQV